MGPLCDSSRPNFIGQLSSPCIMAVVFKVFSAEPWGSATKFQGLPQCISSIIKWANVGLIFMILNYNFYFPTDVFLNGAEFIF